MAASVFVIRQVFVTKSHLRVVALLLKCHGDQRFKAARMQRHP